VNRAVLTPEATAERTSPQDQATQTEQGQALLIFGEARAYVCASIEAAEREAKAWLAGPNAREGAWVTALRPSDGANLFRYVRKNGGPVVKAGRVRTTAEKIDARRARKGAA
jgi:hypothetical protein